jgi:hypothetical protein
VLLRLSNPLGLFFMHACASESAANWKYVEKYKENFSLVLIGQTNYSDSHQNLATVWQ